MFHILIRTYHILCLTCKLHWYYRTFNTYLQTRSKSRKVQLTHTKSIVMIYITYNTGSDEICVNRLTDKIIYKLLDITSNLDTVLLYQLIHTDLIIFVIYCIYFVLFIHYVQLTNRNDICYRYIANKTYLLRDTLTDLQNKFNTNYNTLLQTYLHQLTHSVAIIYLIYYPHLTFPPGAHFFFFWFCFGVPCKVTWKEFLFCLI